MKLALTKIRIQNFKGARDFEIDFSADRTSITGANGTGKTTIADAFSWVLFLLLFTFRCHLIEHPQGCIP